MHAARMLITLPCIHVPKTSKITSEVKYRKILFYRRSDRLAESANLNRISFANLNRISFFLPFPVKNSIIDNRLQNMESIYSFYVC